MSNSKPNYFQRRSKPQGPRANERIRSLDVQVIGSNGSNLGTMPIKKANQAKKKQKIVSLKEIKLRPGTETHDYNFKIKNAKKFITKGDKVKFTVKFKGREMQHTELGKDLMNKIIEETKDIAKVESKPKFEGRQMVMIIQPL